MAPSIDLGRTHIWRAHYFQSLYIRCPVLVAGVPLIPLQVDSARYGQSYDETMAFNFKNRKKNQFDSHVTWAWPDQVFRKRRRSEHRMQSISPDAFAFAVHSVASINDNRLITRFDVRSSHSLRSAIAEITNHFPRYTTYKVPNIRCWHNTKPPPTNTYRTVQNQKVNLVLTRRFLWRCSYRCKRLVVFVFVWMRF